MGLELDDREYAELVAEQTQDELKAMNKVLVKLANNLSQPKEDKAVSDAIKESAKASQEVAKAIRDIPQPKTPDVKINFDHENFVTSMGKIADRIEESNKKTREAFENRPIPTKFDVVNDGWNLKTVNIVYTTADKLTYKK